MSWGAKFLAATALVICGATTPLAAAGGDQASDPRQQSHWLRDPESGCYVYYLGSDSADAVTWSGDCREDAASGSGTATFMNEGRFVESVSGAFLKGKPEGKVRINWADGSQFEGSEAAGHFSGAGVLTNAVGDRFEGQWKDDHLSGHGAVQWANGDRYDGEWQGSKAEGQGIQTWADGRKYEGEWKNDLPNGHGTLTQKDGTKVEGEFVDGKPVPQLPEKKTGAEISPVGGPAGPTTNVVLGRSPQNGPGEDSQSTSSALRLFDAVAGHKFVSIDGSTIALSLSGRTLVREIASPGAATQRIRLMLLNKNQGTVAETKDLSKVIGLFRANETRVEIEYADGHAEALMPNASGGVSLLLTAPLQDPFCLSWYPQGHQFSAEDREVALALYASKLGLSRPAAKQNASLENCSARIIAAPSMDRETATEPAPLPATNPRRPSRAASKTTRAKSRAIVASPAFVRAAQMRSIDEAHASAVPPAHPRIDTGRKTQTASLKAHGRAGETQIRASTCLTVESDGTGWGFRNHCTNAVQFAYCLMESDTAAIAPCDRGAVAGGVPGNSFDRLFADASNTADHEFRWIACDGEASQVVAQLIKPDPPVGKCVPARPS